MKHQTHVQCEVCRKTSTVKKAKVQEQGGGTGKRNESGNEKNRESKGTARQGKKYSSKEGQKGGRKKSPAVLDAVVLLSSSFLLVSQSCSAP